jgi:hypothetical protein
MRRKAYSIGISPIVPSAGASHLQSHPSAQLSQHSLSHLQSGHPSQQSRLLQVATLPLQQPALAAGAVVDDDTLTAPAASAPSKTKPRDNFAIMRRHFLG